MSSRITRIAAAIGIVAGLTTAMAAEAQQQSPPPVAAPAPAPTVTPPPAAATPPPAAATPPPAAAGPPPASATPPPAANSTAAPAATPPAAGEQGTAPAEGEAKLPTVEIIQSQPPPDQPAPEVPQPPKIAKEKPDQVDPAPVVAKSKPKPKPVEQADTLPTPQKPQAPQAQAQPQTQPVQPVAAPPLSTEIKISPVGGSEIPISKVSGSVSHISVEDIKRTGAVDTQSLLQTSVPGVIVTDLQGNGFQTDVQYRGFSSSPVNGVPQGLAIYQNGVRINESFGDIVNWDFLPSNAINDITVVAGNPVFGLNAIGGAISIGMKDGFNSPGTEIDGRAGSFGRIQGAFSTGQRSGAVAAFVALEGAHDDGWRDNSPADIKRMYADLGYKTSEAEFHINFTGAENFVGAVTAAPVELLAIDYARTYTSPQTTNNDMKMVSVNGTVSVTDTMKLSGVAYRRKFTQKHVDANIVDASDCGDGTLCIEGEQALGVGAGVNGNGTIPAGIGGAGGVLGSIDNTSQDAGSMGASVQAVEKSKLFGLGNQFLVGASYDHGDVRYSAASTLGKLGPKFVVSGLGILITGPDDISPRSLTTTNDYYGVYFSDTLDVTGKLAVTVGGRFNVADLSIRDLTGKDPFLNGDNHFQRFNPQVGATYSFVPGLTLYGSYSEANRAPTAAELACADPLNPCLIESFLTADPPLNQVVSHTVELGVRGEQTSWSGHEKFEWGIGLFRTLNTDDIIAVAAQTSGRGFFQNAGETLRQGIDVNASYRTDQYFLYANYNFTAATYETALTLGSPNNPSATLCPGADPKDPNAPTCVIVQPGNTIPGIPQHKFKAGFDYRITPEWKFGADVIASSSQVFFGDEGNQNKRLGGYAKVNLHTSYDINEHVQIYGLVDNVFDARFGTFGNYFNRDAATNASLGEINFTDPRTVVPSAPVAVYGGMKVKF